MWASGYKPEAASYGAPHGVQGRVPQERGATKKGFYILGLFACFGWLYLLLMSDLFLINEIEVRGLKITDPIDVSREVYDLLDKRESWRPWPVRHAWFIDVNELERSLKECLFAEKVTVDKPKTHILRLTIEERTNRLIIHSQKQFVWVDLQGLVVSDLSKDDILRIQERLSGRRASSRFDPPIIRHDLDEPITIGYRIADSINIKQWIEICTEIIKKNIAFREIVLDNNDNTTSYIIAQDGYRVLFDNNSPIQPQLKAYEAFKEAGTNFKVLEYIDVRIPDRVFVK